MPDPNILKDVEIHKRTARVKIPSDNLERMIRDNVRSVLRIPDSTPVITKIKVTQKEEGSPPYKVEKWDVFIDVEYDLPPVKVEK